MAPPRRIPLPPELLARAREYAAGTRAPVTPRDAATVLLLRPPLEVYVMVRHRSMPFAGGMVAFPGGGVAAEDAVALDDGWAGRMGCSAADAAAVVGAAVRELEEETGVRVSPTDLGLWDAWTTPEWESRRYRTWFFTAVLPEGQEARELSTESSHAEWVTPAAAVARADARTWRMLPPTYLSCLRLTTFGSVEEVMAATKEAAVEMFIPALEGETLSTPAWALSLLGEER